MAKRGRGYRLVHVSPSGLSAIKCKSQSSGKARLPLAPFLMLILLPLVSLTAVAGADKKVLFLYGDKSNGVMMGYREVLQSALKAGSPDRITFYEEYMDLSLFPGDDYVALLRDFYRQKYQSQKFDLIIAQSPVVLNFLSRYGEELFPDTPIVFGTLDKSRIDAANLRPNVTGVLADYNFGTTLEAALSMQPDVRSVTVVAGPSPSDVKYLAKARSEFRLLESRVEFTYLTDLHAPWRQVHAMLLQAAAQTTGLRKDPAPRVWQRALSDFYVEYELEVNLDQPEDRVPVLSELHMHIQDAFNEQGVQIMSPHFEGQPHEKVFVPKSGWFPKTVDSPGP